MEREEKMRQLENEKGGDSTESKSGSWKGTCGILPKKCHVASSPLDMQMSSLRRVAWLIPPREEFCPADVPPSPDISHPEFCPADVPSSPDISHPEFCLADVPPSPNILQSAPIAG